MLLESLRGQGWGQSCMQGWGHYNHYLGQDWVYHLDLPYQGGRRDLRVQCHRVGCRDYFHKDSQGHEVHPVQVQTLGTYYLEVQVHPSAWALVRLVPSPF